jgi:hypothetical protein
VFLLEEPCSNFFTFVMCHEGMWVLLGPFNMFSNFDGLRERAREGIIVCECTSYSSNVNVVK